MINYNKLLEKLNEKGITTYTIRKKNLFGQELLRKIKMCSVSDEDRRIYGELSDAEIINMKLQKYESEKGVPFKFDVSTKTIEELCQLLQCQPYEIMDWHVDLDESLSYIQRLK